MPAERRIAFVKMKPAKFRHVWRGALDLNPERAVYTNWRVDRIFISTLSPLYGLDWGWVDPFACLEFYVIEPDDPETQRGTIYISKEVYGSRIPAKELPDRVRETMPMSELAMIVADSAEPKSIDDFNSAGFNVVGATKGPGSIRAGISFIQGYDIVVSPECPNVAKELTLYMWKQDEKTKRILRDPVDKDNHAMDALRYGLSMYTPPPRGGGVTML
jgi:phage terminase large subunit